MNEGEGGVIGSIFVELDVERLGEVTERPGVVFAGIITWEVGRGYICDGFGVDVDDLWGRSAQGERSLAAVWKGDLGDTYFSSPLLFQ